MIKSDLHFIANNCDNLLVGIVIISLILSCLLTLLMITPLTIQYIGSILECKKDKKINAINRNNSNETPKRGYNKNEIELYKYRIMFNLSVLMTIIFSSVPLATYMTQMNPIESEGISSFEQFINLWIVCQVKEYLDMSSRIFFASMVAIPSFLVFLHLATNVPKSDNIFRVIYILSWVFLIVALASPVYFITYGFEAIQHDNNSLLCSHSSNMTIYRQMRSFELIGAHLIPLVILIPSIIYEKCKLKFSTNDRLYERLIFIATNIPIAFIDTLEQTINSKEEYNRYIKSYSNFYLVCTMLYHVGYTGMFLVWPIHAVFTEGRNEQGRKFEVSGAYKFFANRKTIRKTINSQFSSLRDRGTNNEEE